MIGTIKRPSASLEGIVRAVYGSRTTAVPPLPTARTGRAQRTAHRTRLVGQAMSRRSLTLAR